MYGGSDGSCYRFLCRDYLEIKKVKKRFTTVLEVFVHFKSFLSLKRVFSCLSVTLKFKNIYKSRVPKKLI